MRSASINGRNTSRSVILNKTIQTGKTDCFSKLGHQSYRKGLNYHANHARSVPLSLDVCVVRRLQDTNSQMKTNKSPHGYSRIWVHECFSKVAFLNYFRTKDGFYLLTLHFWECLRAPRGCKSQRTKSIYHSVSPKCELKGSPEWRFFFWTLFLQPNKSVVLVESLALKWNLSCILKYIIRWKKSHVNLSLNFEEQTEYQRAKLRSSTSTSTSSLI